MRSVQRQSSGRSSVTSPLVSNENGFRPSWSLAAKLHLRAATSCRHPSDSPIHGSSLGKIGEADDHVSTSCFGSLRNLSGSFHDHLENVKREYRSSSRAPLALAEGGAQPEPMVNKAVPTESSGKSAAELVGRNPLLDPIDNNNHIAFVDQSDSVNSSPVKESPPQIEEVHSIKPSTSKTTAEQSKTARATEKDSSTPTPPVAASSKVKPTTKTRKCEKSEIKTPTRRPSTQQRKDSGKPQEVSTPVSQQKQRTSSSTPNHAPSPAPKKAPPTSRNSSVSSTSSKHRAPEKTISREGSKVSLGSDKASSTKPNSSTTRTTQPKSSDSPVDNRTVRSSSMASLRTPQSAARSPLKRDSKSEEKGLSFFKSALRQKESRRSADLGKTNLLSKKPTTTKSLSQDKADSPASPPKEIALTPKKHSVLPQHKAKSSPDEKQTQSSPCAKKTSDKYLRFPSSTKPSPKAQ